MKLLSLSLALLLLGCRPKSPAPFVAGASSGLHAIKAGVLDAEMDLVEAQAAKGSAAKDAFIKGAYNDLQHTLPHFDEVDENLQHASKLSIKLDHLWDHLKYLGWRTWELVYWIIGIVIAGLIASLWISNITPQGWMSKSWACVKAKLFSRRNRGF